MDSNEIARFWLKVDVCKASDCWPWKGGLNAWGYGWYYPSHRLYGKTHFLAHRVAYEATNGAIPDGMYVLHSCDNRRCCNPAHLRAGTHADNMQDMLERKRARGPKHNFSDRKLSTEQVKMIRESSKTQQQLADELGVSRDVVSQIRRGKTYRDLL